MKKLTEHKPKFKTGELVWLKTDHTVCGLILELNSIQAMPVYLIKWLSRKAIAIKTYYLAEVIEEFYETPLTPLQIYAKL